MLGNIKWRVNRRVFSVFGLEEAILLAWFIVKM